MPTLSVPIVPAPSRAAESASSDFVPFGDGPSRCGGCGDDAALAFRFAYAYQPIVDLGNGTVWGHEALVRGPNGEGASTVLDQVNDANRYRFDQACRVKAIKQAAALGLSQRLSINFLPNAIYRPEVCIRTTLEAARTHGFPLDRIVFEATEGERVDSGAWLADVMREYQRCGFLTAIDDFGAGYAGLTLLSQFRPDLVKVDMALIRHVDADPVRQAIVRAILRMCADLDVAVIAEGIETAAERDFLADAGVRLMQGYLFARPAFNALAAVAGMPTTGRAFARA